MSVRKGDRGEGKLQVLNKAREMKKYTLGLIKTDKHIPKSARWLYATPIAVEVRAACNAIRRANSVRVSQDTDGRYSREEYAYRRTEQVKAHASLEALCGLVEDVYDAGYISGRQAEFWAGLIYETDEKLKAWMRTDKERYEK